MTLSDYIAWLDSPLSNFNVVGILSIVLVVFLWVCLHWWQQPGKNHLPGLFPWPIVGNAPFLGTQPHKTFQKWAQIYGPIYRLKLGGVKVIVLSDLGTVKAALLKQKHIFSGRPQSVTNKYVGNGKSMLVNDETTQGDFWNKQRTLLVRHFHKFSTSTKIRNELNETITKDVLHMLDKMESLSSQSYFHPHDTVRKGVANTLCSMCFGKRYNYDDEKFSELLNISSAFGKVAGVGALIDTMPWITVFSKYRKSLEHFVHYVRTLMKWSKERVNEVLSTYNPDNPNNVVTSLTSEFLDQADTDDVEKLTDEERDLLLLIVIEILGAGQETTPTAFTWMLNYLLLYPDVLQKIKEELHEVIGDRLPTLSDRPNLPYIEAFIHETFRHSSFAHSSLPHRTIEDTTLRGYHIPKDTMVIINQYAINRDPENWKEPDKFDPMRFLSKGESGKWQVNGAAVEKYLLFSMGLRKCPGSESAKMWLFLTTSILVQTCSIKLDHEHPPNLDTIYGLNLMPAMFKMKLSRKPVI